MSLPPLKFCKTEEFMPLVHYYLNWFYDRPPIRTFKKKERNAYVHKKKSISVYANLIDILTVRQEKEFVKKNPHINPTLFHSLIDEFFIFLNHFTAPKQQAYII